MDTRGIDPLKDLGELLLTVEKPARYVGGEYGSLARDGASLRMVIAFPDLYEIGMSNQALRILYNRLNEIEDISCDRAFAPAPDFEDLLRSRRLPLYGLDTGIPLHDSDILCFTLGYELGITEVLAMLDMASIPLHWRERKEGHPLVIMGGPCVSNPLPYERFIDAFWIGEAEDGFFDLARELRDLKKAGQGRAVLLDRVRSNPHVWASGKEKARRAIDTAFPFREDPPAVFPVPSMKTVQHHGAVEIMRGCPNGCRFCHAGLWYRPMRQKTAGHILREAAAFINSGGYREISLSSLSTGDYRCLDELLESLNREYISRHISFQLPSLRVSSFSLPLLEKVSEVRKSGLTFAVETAVDAWQWSINKEVSRDQVVAILREAKKRGWRGSKFYFMVGLPVGGLRVSGREYPREYSNNNEEVEIVNFVDYAGRKTGMHFNINLGTFVPKPHTPYQWIAQIDEDGARKKIDHVRHRLKALGHKVGVHDPFIAMIEGILSRGDGRVGDIIEEAYRRGCRLDAWNEYIKKDIWRPLFTEYAPLIEDILGPRDPALPLPWDCIDSGVSKGYLTQEYRKSDAEEITLPCANKCTHPCGICGEGPGIVKNNIHDDNLLYANSAEEQGSPVSEIPMVQGETLKKRDPETHRVLFSFAKQDTAVFLPHLGLIEVFSMALIRAGIPVLFSQGFNPLPRIDFASPLSVGISAEAEIATVDIAPGGGFNTADFKERLNRALPRGIWVVDTLDLIIPSGVKKHAASSLLWGYGYEAGDGGPLKTENAFRFPGAADPGLDYVRAADEKRYRLSRIGQGSVFALNRKSVLARGLQNGETPESYFVVYGSLYRHG
jgi:radical SAM superfamily enzyme YgiQ (UPF0313 family)